MVNASKWQLLHLGVGEAELAIYISRKSRVEGGTRREALPVFKSLKARVWIDFRFFLRARATWTTS